MGYKSDIASMETLSALIRPDAPAVAFAALAAQYERDNRRTPAAAIARIHAYDRLEKWIQAQYAKQLAGVLEGNRANTLKLGAELSQSIREYHEARLELHEAAGYYTTDRSSL